MIRSVWTVARRELRSYFDHPTAYVLAVAFLGLSLYLAFRNMFASDVATLRPLFGLLPILFSIFIPAATMRSLAEERRGRTLDWLLSQPVSEAEVVLGKFLGDWLFVLVALAGTLPTALGLLAVSDADPGIVLAQYVGASLLAAQLVALGLWASAMTRNQITAFIVAAVLSFALYLIGLDIVQIGLPPAISGALARLSVVAHFENVARGVVDLRDVLYFVSTGALFLMLATGAVSGARLSRERPEFRRLRTGTAVAAALVLVVNLLGSHVRGRLDLTRGDLYTLAPGTKHLLGGLDDIVQVKLFASKELPPEVQLQLRDVRDLLSDMKRAGDGKLVVTELHPDGDEDAAQQASSYGIQPVEFNVLRNDEFQVRRGYYGLAVVYADKQKVFPVIRGTDDLEYQLASTVASLTADTKPAVAFVSGYGAKSQYQIPNLQDALADRYTLRSLQVGDSAPPIPGDSVQVVVLAGPTQALDSVAVGQLERFIDGGGSALLMVDPVQLDNQSPTAIPVRSGLEPLLERSGVKMDAGMVYDLASNERVSLGRRGLFNVVSAYPLWPVAVPVEGQPQTRGLNALDLGWAGALEIEDSVHVVPLWQTTENAGLKPAGSPIMPDQDWDAPPEDLSVRTVAVAVDPSAGSGSGSGGDGTSDASGGGLDAGKGRMVIVADANWAEQQFVQANPQNLVFLANAIDWLAQDESLIRIRSKNRTPPALVLQSDLSRGLLKWGNLVGVPLLLVLAGVARVTGRKRRAMNRWKEVVA